MSVTDDDGYEGGDPPCWAHLFDDVPCSGDDAHQRTGHAAPADAGSDVRDYSFGGRQPSREPDHRSTENPTPLPKAPSMTSRCRLCPDTAISTGRPI